MTEVCVQKYMKKNNLVVNNQAGVSLSFEVGGHLQESSWAENYT